MSVVTFGEIMLRLSPPGYERLIQADCFDATYGGAEANVAAALSCFGMPTQFVTKLPVGPLGDACLGHLRRHNVGVDHVVRGGKRLGLYYLEPGVSQRPATVIYDRSDSAITTLASDHVNWATIFEDAEWFHWTGITPALGDHPQAVLSEALSVATSAGTPVSCDLNYRSKLWSKEAAQDTLRPLMTHVDVCIGDAGAAADCLGLEWSSLGISDADVEATRVTEARPNTNAQIAKHLSQKFQFDAVALTLRESSSARRHGWSAMLLGGAGTATPLAEPTRSRRYEIELVDRVGAGDSFAAGLFYGLLTKEHAADALEFGAAAACLKQTVPGDFSQSTAKEVKQLVARDADSRIDR